MTQQCRGVLKLSFSRLWQATRSANRATARPVCLPGSLNVSKGKHTLTLCFSTPDVLKQGGETMKLRHFLTIGYIFIFLLCAPVAWSQNQIDNSMFYRESWAVVIGINRYTQFQPLRYAVNDARAIGARLKRMGFNVILLENEQATKEKILDVLKFQLPEIIGTDDRLVLFYSGHGAAGTLTGTGGELGFLVPVDGKAVVDGRRLNIIGERIQIDDNDYAAFVNKTNFISTEELREIFDNLAAKHILSIIDGCYSGFIDPTSYTRLSRSDRISSQSTISEGGRGFDAIVPGTSSTPRKQSTQKTETSDGLKLTALDTIQILTAGSSGEKAFERAGHGIFTLYLLKALDGAARFTRNSCLITTSELAAYLKQNVLQASRNNQNPLFNRISGEGEFVFVMPSCKPVASRDLKALRLIKIGCIHRRTAGQRSIRFNFRLRLRLINSGTSMFWTQNMVTSSNLIVVETISPNFLSGQQWNFPGGQPR